MTQMEIDKLFEQFNYDEARQILREEAARLGHQVSANERKPELIAKACNGVPMTSAEVQAVQDRIKERRAYIASKRAKAEAPAGGDEAPSSGDGEPAGGETGADEGEVKKGDATPQPQPLPMPPEMGKRGDDGRDVAYSPDDEDELYSKYKIHMELAEQARKMAEELAKRRAEEAKRKAEEAKRAAGQTHAGLDKLLKTLETTGLAYLVGPAGTGKSTMAMDACAVLTKVAKDSDKFFEKFAQISFSPDTTASEMIGRCDINGNFHESEVVRVFRDGGLILFDEIDNADASMLTKLNTAIANGTFATPKGMVKRNKDTYIVCTANTYGTGPDAMYVGRTRLDAATLDRFVCSTIEVDYDTGLEHRIMNVLPAEQHKALAEFVKNTREKIKASHLRRICSTRFVINAVKWMASKKATLSDMIKSFVVGWPENERKAIGLKF